MPQDPLMQAQGDALAPLDARDVRERFAELYEGLLPIAKSILSGRQFQSMEPAGLVSEAFEELLKEEAARLRIGRSLLGEKPDSAFKACFGAACRDVMYEHHRRRARRRDVPLASSMDFPSLPAADFSDLHWALSALAEKFPLEAKIIEAKEFGDATLEECSALFGISPRSVTRYYRHGIAWLKLALERQR